MYGFKEKLGVYLIVGYLFKSNPLDASIQVAQDALTVTKLTTKQESILGSCIQKLEKIQVDQIKVSSI